MFGEPEPCGGVAERFGLDDELRARVVIVLRVEPGRLRTVVRRGGNGWFAPSHTLARHSQPTGAINASIWN
jgi:hypothetical protein